jgi:hypothetical protein
MDLGGLGGGLALIRDRIELLHGPRLSRTESRGRTAGVRTRTRFRRGGPLNPCTYRQPPLAVLGRHAHARDRHPGRARREPAGCLRPRAGGRCEADGSWSRARSRRRVGRIACPDEHALRRRAARPRHVRRHRCADGRRRPARELRARETRHAPRSGRRAENRLSLRRRWRSYAPILVIRPVILPLLGSARRRRSHAEQQLPYLSSPRPLRTLRETRRSAYFSKTQLCQSLTNQPQTNTDEHGSDLCAAPLGPRTLTRTTQGAQPLPFATCRGTPRWMGGPRESVGCHVQLDYSIP